MKKMILLFVAIFAIISGVKAQFAEHLSFAFTLGTGIALSSPASTPFNWQVLGYYDLNKRFSAGIGTGVSIYEKTLIPLFADVKFNLTRPRKVTPYVECGVGYGFAPAKEANGGFYLSPSVGIQWTVCGNKKLLFAVGCDMQSLERLKRYENQYLKVEFKERLAHNTLSIKAGFAF